MSKCGIGIIGCGIRIRQVFDGLFKVNNDVNVVALCDTSKNSIQATIDEFKINPKVYDDYRDLCNDPNVDLVFVGSWNCYHREQIVAAFEAGKNVFTEKQLATNLEDCISIYESWQKHKDCMFMIGFTLRFSPHYRRIKETLDSGIIGDVVSMEFNETLGFNHGAYIMGGWRSLNKYAGTHLLEKCCHDIDIANWLVGSRVKKAASFGGLNVFKPENAGWVDEYKCSKTGQKPFFAWNQPHNPFTNEKDIIDNQVIIAEFENEVRATFHTNCCCGIPERRMYIIGTKGAIRADAITGKIEVCNIGFDEEIKDISTDVKGNHAGGDEILCAELADAIFKKHTPATGMKDAIYSAATCFGIDKAMEEGIVYEFDSIWQQVDSVMHGDKKSCLI